MGKIIVFANQKGGVGKSTICTLYANHLSGSEEPDKPDVLLVETDQQKSIYHQRQADITTWGEEEMKYNVEYFKLVDMQKSEELMKDAQGLKPEKGKEIIILVDVPGNVTDAYLAPLFVYADYIVCPFQYENKVLDSTSTFVRVIQELRKKFPSMTAELIFVPNKIDVRKGTKADLEVQRQVDEIWNKLGTVLPKIPDRVDFERLTTYLNTPKQEDLVRNTFSELDKHLLSFSN